MLAQQLADASQLRRRSDRLDREAQLGTARTAAKHRQLDSQLAPEMLDDLASHVRLGGGGEARDRRRRPLLALRQLADDAAGIEVVRSKVVPPLGQAVRLVEHPGTELSLLDRLQHGPVAQLLGRHVEDRHLAQPHPLERLAALGGRQQAGECHRAVAADLAVQMLHLVLHQRLQR